MQWHESARSRSCSAGDPALQHPVQSWLLRQSGQARKRRSQLQHQHHLPPHQRSLRHPHSALRTRTRTRNLSVPAAAAAAGPGRRPRRLQQLRQRQRQRRGYNGNTEACGRTRLRIPVPAPQWRLCARRRHVVRRVDPLGSVAGYQVVWQAPKDLPVYAATYTGSFEAPPEQVMRDTTLRAVSATCLPVMTTECCASFIPPSCGK